MSKNFTIGEELFKEMQWINRTDVVSDSDEEDALYALGEKQIAYEIKHSDDEMLEDDYDSLSEEEQAKIDDDITIVTDEDFGKRVLDSLNDDALFLGIIPKDTVLDRALISYFRRAKGLSYDEMLEKLGLVEDDDNLYFITGCGYDIVDSDLLGGDGSGKTKKQFLDWLNA